MNTAKFTYTMEKSEGKGRAAKKNTLVSEYNFEFDSEKVVVETPSKHKFTFSRNDTELADVILPEEDFSATTQLEINGVALNDFQYVNSSKFRKEDVLASDRLIRLLFLYASNK